jgi:DNA-binding response OmpR family regulator
MKRNILLVEYDSDTIDTIKGILHHEIFDITVAGDASVAMVLLQKQNFHLVVTEALLPKSHGFTLCQYITGHFPNTKIIIISEQLKEKNERREALRSGASEFFEKPLDVVKFRKKVTKLLDIREKTDTGDGHVGDTTNLYVIPLLDELKSEQAKDKGKEKEKKSNTEKFKNILEEMKDRESYEIDLE